MTNHVDTVDSFLYFQVDCHLVKLPQVNNTNFVMFQNFIKNFQIFIKSLWADVFILDGYEVSTNENLKLIFSGDEKSRSYIKNIAFNNNCKESLLGNMSFLQLYYLININYYNCSLAIIECFFPLRIIYKGVKDFFVPLWVNSSVEIPLLALNRSLKEDLRKIRKKKLEYLISSKPEDIHNFYYNMYIPTVQTRHQERTIETKYDEIIKKVNDGKCELLLVLQEKLPIAGVLIIKDTKLPRLWLNGLLNAKSMNLSGGIISATYYFSSKYLEEKGFKEMHMGWTRSFLNDGVFKYKNKFNHSLIGSGKKGFVFKYLNYSNSLKNFYINNPFIYKRGRQLMCAFFIDGDKQFSSEDFDKFQKHYVINGISDLMCFQFNNSKGDFSKFLTTKSH